MSLDPEFERLLSARADAGTPAEIAAARRALDDFNARRALESETERAAFVEAYGGDPVVGTVIADGGTIHSPPGFTDVNSAFITLPDGRVMAKDDLLAGRPSDPTDPSAPPAFDGPPAA